MVKCSGDALEHNTVLLTMVLYCMKGQAKHTLASVSIVQDRCLTADSFSSCTVVERDSRKTTLKSLVVDLPYQESRTCGCTVGYEANGWTQSVSWFVEVRRNSKLTVIFLLCCKIYHVMTWD